MLPSEETRQRLLSKFRIDTTQNLKMLRTQLPNLNRSDNQDAIVTMFFAAHTIKGNLGMMQMLEDTLHTENTPAANLEALLLTLRKLEILVDHRVIDTIETYLNELENQFLQNK